MVLSFEELETRPPFHGDLLAEAGGVRLTFLWAPFAANWTTLFGPNARPGIGRIVVSEVLSNSALGRIFV